MTGKNIECFLLLITHSFNWSPIWGDTLCKLCSIDLDSVPVFLKVAANETCGQVTCTRIENDFNYFTIHLTQGEGRSVQKRINEGLDPICIWLITLVSLKIYQNNLIAWRLIFFF